MKSSLIGGYSVGLLFLFWWTSLPGEAGGESCAHGKKGKHILVNRELEKSKEGEKTTLPETRMLYKIEPLHIIVEITFSP